MNRAKLNLSITKLTSIVLVLAFISTGCVSSRKYKDLEAQQKMDAEQLAKSKDTVGEMTTVINDLQNRLGSTNLDKTKLQSSVDEMRQALSEMNARKRETEKRMKEYQDLVKRFRSLIDTGKLSVKIVDGRMVVVLGSDILFSSGSAQLSEEGKNAIKEITGVLSQIPDRKFQIEGHTDNVPIKTARFPSNWELASARAVTVVDTMINGGLEKSRISAATFADARPIADNKSVEGRQANRRIEIVVVPDLTQMPGFEELNNLSNQHNTSSQGSETKTSK